MIEVFEAASKAILRHQFTCSLAYKRLFSIISIGREHELLQCHLSSGVITGKLHVIPKWSNHRNLKSGNWKSSEDMYLMELT